MEYLGIFIGSGGLIGVIGLFFYCGKWFGKMESSVKAMESSIKSLEQNMEKGFQKIDQRFEKIDDKIESISKSIQNLDVRISKIEGREEDKFRARLELIFDKKVKEQETVEV